MVVRNPDSSLGPVSVTSVIFLCDFFLKNTLQHVIGSQVFCLYKQVRLDVSLGSYTLGVGFLTVAWRKFIFKVPGKFFRTFG